MSVDFREFKPVFQIANLSLSEIKGVQAEALHLFEDHQSMLLPPDVPMELAEIDPDNVGRDRWDAPDRIFRNRAEKVLLVVRASICSQRYEYTDHGTGKKIDGRVSNMIANGTAARIISMHKAADMVLTDVPYDIDLEVDGYSDDPQDPDPEDAYDIDDREHLGQLEMTVSSDASHDTVAGYLARSENPDLDANVVRTIRNWLADAVEIKK